MPANRTLRSLLIASALLTSLVATPQPCAAQNPIVIASQHVELELEHDANVGVRLTKIVQLQGSRFTFENDPPVEEPQGLWEIRGTHIGGGTFVVHPNGAMNSFPIPSGYVFIWPNVPIPGTAESLFVWLEIELLSNDQVARWRIHVARNPAADHTASLDEIDCPILYLKQPVTLQPLEREFDASARARLLIPINNLSSYTASNTPLAMLFQRTDLEGDVSLRHPNPGQVLQFGAVYDADTQSAGYGRMVYFGSEDTTGHHKRFVYGRRIIYGTAPPEGSPEPVPTYYRFMWRHTYYPAFAPSEFANTFDAPYPAVVGALKAKSDNFWYDAASQYREFVESSGIVGPKTEANPNYGAFAGPAVLAAFFPPVGDLDSSFRRSLDVTRALRDTIGPFAPASPEPLPSYVHWQIYRVDGLFAPPVLIGQPPLLNIHPNAKLVAAQAWNAFGIRTTARMAQGLGAYEWSAPATTERYRRDGTEFWPGPTVAFDYGAPDAATWLADVQIGTILAGAEFRGTYIDGSSGTGVQLCYDNPAHGVNQPHAAHGGDYYAHGVRDLWSGVRTNLETARGGDTDTLVMSEAAQEFYVGDLDFVQRGYDYVPDHLLLAESTILLADPLWSQFAPSIQNVPVQARNWSPPLWHAVYHEWGTTNSPVMPITTAGLATGPYDPPGLAPGPWEDLQCYAFAAALVEGSKPTIFPYFPGYDHSVVRYAGGVIEYASIMEDPARVGEHVLDFVKLLHESQERGRGGQFTLYGRMQRPLDVDYEDPSVQTVTNPTNATINPIAITAAGVGCDTLPCDGPFLILPTPEAHPLAERALQEYDVPAVLHSVWRNPEDTKTGIVLVNWTRSPAAWAGTFDPALYDMTGPYHVVKIPASGTPLLLGGPFTGAVTINGSGLQLGLLPPQSVTILSIE
ncbi:MAG: hypothetical protein AAF628_32935 [Planctomycetota bacterium]